MKDKSFKRRFVDFAIGTTAILLRKTSHNSARKEAFARRKPMVINMLLWLAIIVVTVFLDQLTKYLTVLHLKPIDTLPIIEDVLHLSYVENTGAAFGMMKDARWVFMITSTVAIIGILGYMIYRTYVQKIKMPWMEALSLSLIVGGGIGNMIDRTVLGYVVDMIDCRFIDFAVFNVADSFVCVGAGLMVLYLIITTVQEARAEKSARSQPATESEEISDEAIVETEESMEEILPETAVETADEPAEVVAVETAIPAVEETADGEPVEDSHEISVEDIVENPVEDGDHD